MAEAEAEARQPGLRENGALREGDDRALVRLSESDAAWIAMPARSRLKRRLGRCVCLVWRAAFEDASGRLVDSRLVAVLLDARRDPAHNRREWIRSLLQQADAGVRARAEAECDDWAAEAGRVADAFLATRLARERNIARPRAACSPASQPGLFDRRAERRHQARAAAAASQQAAVERRGRSRPAGRSRACPPGSLLVLVP